MSQIPGDKIATLNIREHWKEISRVRIPEVSKFSKDISTFIDGLFGYLKAESKIPGMTEADLLNHLGEKIVAKLGNPISKGEILLKALFNKYNSLARLTFGRLVLNGFKELTTTPISNLQGLQSPALVKREIIEQIISLFFKFVKHFQGECLKEALKVSGLAAKKVAKGEAAGVAIKAARKSLEAREGAWFKGLAKAGRWIYRKATNLFIKKL